MVDRTLRSFGCMLAMSVLCGCAGTANGVLSNETTYVDSVEVVQHDNSAPPTFAENLRAAVVAGASFYGATGRPVAVKIDLDKVHFKNALKALTIGDDNLAEGHVAVLDPSTGQQLGAFVVQANAETSGVSVGSIAIEVAGVVDPTGIVSIVALVGEAASADIDRSGTALAMRANLTDATLRQTFGDAKTRLVLMAKKNQPRSSR